MTHSSRQGLSRRVGLGDRAHPHADITELEPQAHSSRPVSDIGARPSASVVQRMVPVSEGQRCIFQQPWWLECVTGGRYEEVTVKNDGRVVGWLPYVVNRRWGFATSDMPLLTHTLGPIIHAGNGRPNTQLLNRF